MDEKIVDETAYQLVIAMFDATQSVTSAIDMVETVCASSLEKELSGMDADVFTMPISLAAGGNL